MVQRIQSIFLLLASGGFWSLFALPFATSKDKSGYYQDGVLTIQDHTVLLGLAVAGGLISFIAIFLFKNRNLQKSITWLAAICGLALGGFSYYLFSDSGQSANLGGGIGIPFISLILAIAAIIFIGKDEKLVKSMDRLR